MIQIFFFECHSKILKNYYNFLSFKRTKHINRFHAPFPLPLNVSKSSKQIHIYAQCLDMMIFLCGWMYEKSILLFNYVIQMFDRYPLLSGANKEKKYVSSFTRCLCTKSVFMKKHKNIIGSRLNENIFHEYFLLFYILMNHLMHR